MMPDTLTPYVGVAAAFLASLSYIPQVRKAWPRGATRDLSFSMLLVLTIGLSLWLLYGVLRGDWIIIAANAMGASLSATVLACKLRDMHLSRYRRSIRRKSLNA
jgi:MtN3 and saliva related transmembrane protein